MALCSDWPVAGEPTVDASCASGIGFVALYLALPAGKATCDAVSWGRCRLPCPGVWWTHQIWIFSLGHQPLFHLVDTMFLELLFVMC